MKEQKSFILILASAGMMLGWFYTWNSFILHYLSKGPIPIPESAFILALAALITAIHRSRGSRWIYVIVLHGVGFFLALLLITYSVNNFPYPFWNIDWISFYLSIEKGFMEWLTLLTLFATAILLWFYGIRLIIVTTDTRCINSRFDLGLTFFLLLLLIKLLMRYKGVPLAYDRSIGFNFISFIILGLFAQGLVRNKGSSLAGNITYFRGIGVILSFTIFVILFGGGLVMLFLPGMTKGAELGYDLMRTITRPIGNIIVIVLRTLFMQGCRRSPDPDTSSDSNRNSLDLLGTEKDAGIVGLIIVWTMSILIALGGLTGILFLLHYFFRRVLRWIIKFLFSKSPQEGAEQSLWALIFQVLMGLKKAALSLIGRIFQNRTGDKGPRYYYHFLLGWGNRSGLPHALYETPKEYGFRLSSSFTDLNKEIIFIVEMFNRSAYGGLDPDEKQFHTARLFKRRMKSPKLWLARLRILLFSSTAAPNPAK